MIVIDVAALRRAAERSDAGPMAAVERRWLGDMLKALLDPANVRILDEGNAPATMVPA